MFLSQLKKYRLISKGMSDIYLLKSYYKKSDILKTLIF